MAASPMNALAVRKRLLRDRIALERAELTAHVRGVRRAVSWIAIGAGALGALRGARGLLTARKTVDVARQVSRLPKLAAGVAAGAAALWGLGKFAASTIRRRWMARRGAVDVAPE